jgi:hypothetical protein
MQEEKKNGAAQYMSGDGRCVTPLASGARQSAGSPEELSTVVDCLAVFDVS